MMRRKFWLPVLPLLLFFIVVILIGMAILHSVKPDVEPAVIEVENNPDYLERKRKRLEKKGRIIKRLFGGIVGSEKD